MCGLVKSLKQEIDKKNAEIASFQQLQNNYKSQRKINFLISEQAENSMSDKGLPLYARDLGYLKTQQDLVDKM